MKWWSWTTKISITAGIIGITIGCFFNFIGGPEVIGSELGLGEYKNIAKAFFWSGFILLLSGLLIGVVLSESKKKSS